MTTLAEKREQVAGWYDCHATRADGGAFSRMSIEWASKVRDGRADHRLDQMLAGQAEFDAEPTAA